MFFFHKYRPEEVHHQFSVTALTGVLQCAAQKRRFVREDKSLEKMEKSTLDKRTSQVQSSGGDQDNSRSNSQMSVGAPSQYPLQQQSSTMMGKHNLYQPPWNCLEKGDHLK